MNVGILILSLLIFNQAKLIRKGLFELVYFISLMKPWKLSFCVAASLIKSP